jgi:hypothetical protein
MGQRPADAQVVASGSVGCGATLRTGLRAFAPDSVDAPCPGRALQRGDETSLLGETRCGPGGGPGSSRRCRRPGAPCRWSSRSQGALFGDLDGDTANLLEVAAEEWAGDVADTYNEHRRKLTRDIRTTADLADTVAGELLRASNTLTASQRQLDGSLLELRNFVYGMSTVDGMVPYPQAEKQSPKCQDLETDVTTWIEDG